MEAPTRPDPWDAARESDDVVTARLLESVPGADVVATAVCFDIIRAADRLQQDFEVSVHRPAGLSWAAFRNMFALFTLGPLPPAELARIHSVSQASTSSIVKTLLKHGYVTRKPSASDGRSVIITLTAKGRRICLELFERNNAREVLWAGALTAAEQAMLIQLLNKVRLQELPSPDADTD